MLLPPPRGELVLLPPPRGQLVLLPPPRGGLVLYCHHYVTGMEAGEMKEEDSRPSAGRWCMKAEVEVGGGRGGPLG